MPLPKLILHQPADGQAKNLQTVGYDNTEKKADSIFSKRIRAGKRRTYFFDVRTTKGSDYYLTITESRKRFDDNGYDRHKIFLYKEDFNKFIKALNETADYVKTELMPDFDFDAYNHEESPLAETNHNGDINIEKEPVQQVEDKPEAVAPQAESSPQSEKGDEEVDKW